LVCCVDVVQNIPLAGMFAVDMPLEVVATHALQAERASPLKPCLTQVAM